MITLGRQIAGWVALVSYLVMGGLLYFTVLPEAGGVWPPDFRLLGYDTLSISDFVTGLSSDGRDAYGMLLRRWDRVFIVSFALWVILFAWRGGWMKFAVAFFAVIYALVDLAENAAIAHFLWVDVLDPDVVAAASHLTMAKFAALYLCVLVLIVHLRRAA